MGMMFHASPAAQVPGGRHHRGNMGSVVIVLLAIGLTLSSLMPVFEAAGAAAQNSSQQQAQVPLPPPGRVIVVLQPGARAADVARGVNATPRQVYGRVFNGFAATLPAAAIQALARNPNVAYLAGDKPVEAVAQTQPTGVQRIGATGNAVAAIDGVDTRVGADIAVIDTGIDPSHPDLYVAGGVDCVAGDSKNSYADDNGHGTHVAGTIAARDNSVGVVGVAPGAAVWAVKVLNASQGGYMSDVICGLDWVVARAGTIDVVNMSLTTSMTTVGTCASPNGDAFHAAICAVVQAGVTVVAAAGNRAEDAGTTAPAKYEEVIAVSAVTDYDGRPGKLSTATGCSGGDDTFATYSNHGTIVDIAAPGSCITSTLPGSYGAMSGTSMATPHVAGAAALFRARNAGASPGAVRSWLLTEAAQPQSSAVGFSGDPDGVAEPMLTLGATVPGERYPPGDPNPSFRGSRLSIARSTTSIGTTASTLAHDGSTSTSWETTSSTVPIKATLTLDLGATRTLTGLKWVYRQTGSADEVLIQTSLDNVTWRTVGRYGNAPAGSWYGEDMARDGRYVRFTFLNPNGDAVLAYLAEVQIWGGISYPPGTAYPSFSGTKLSIARSTGSSNANASTRAHDGSTSTSWETTVTTTPTSSALHVDLGITRRLSGIKWRFRVTGAADEMLIQTSIDGSTWRTVGRYGNAPAGRWYGVATVRDA
ncbi:MAG: S8 family serine peptidase, partial [Chloroflexota bacterium]|nr:S8 family serine peptidase [Chloroflexota bacterium]